MPAEWTRRPAAGSMGLAVGLMVGVDKGWWDKVVADPRIETLSDGAGEKTAQAAGGELASEALGWFLGEAVALPAVPGSDLGAIMDTDLRDWWWRFMMARCSGGG